MFFLDLTPLCLTTLMRSQPILNMSPYASRFLNGVELGLKNNLRRLLRTSRNMSILRKLWTLCTSMIAFLESASPSGLCLMAFDGTGK